MKIFKDRFLILSLLLGLFIRLILTPVAGFKFDVDTWFTWAQRLNDVGFIHFYSPQVWTDYTPGFLYILAVLGFIKNLFQIEPSQFYMILKLPSIFAEIAIGLIIYQIIPKKFLIWGKVGLIFVILNPSFIFNSSIFGQFDSLFSLTLLLSVYFLNQKKIITSSLFWGLSFLLKPQAILLSPIFFFYIFKNFSHQFIIKLIVPAILIIFFSFFPFFINNPIGGPINLVFNQLGFYPYNSIFAYNFWGIFGFWIQDSKTWLNISYQNWGFLLFIIFWMIMSLFYLKRRSFKDIPIFTLSVLSALSFFFLLTRMHERYLYPSLIFLIIISALKKSPILLILTIILSFVHFLDLYYVYIYYNQFYLKIPQAIYNAFLYNLADKNIQLLSLFSTLIFFLISISILKLDNEYKKA